MIQYTFYIDGLGKEACVTAESYHKAYDLVWNALSLDDQDKVSYIDCIDQVELF